MADLFNEDNNQSDEELKINKDYANTYNSWRQKEELNRLKAKYDDADLSSDGSTSSDEDEANAIPSEQFDKDFYQTLSFLKKKDPVIYQKDVIFFPNDVDSQGKSNEKEVKGNSTSKKEKKVSLRDYERKIIIERGGKYSDSEDEDSLQQQAKTSHHPSYVEEQRQLKESFKSALIDDDQGDDTDLLKPKQKGDEEKQQEEAAYKLWLKGQQPELDEKEQEVLKPLRDFWTNPSLDKNEQFLRDYILGNKFLDNEMPGQHMDYDHVVHDSDDNLSEDEKNILKQEEFEHKYNFRFEEPDKEFIKRYPRTVENTLRKKDTRRAQKRVEIRSRKEEEKLKKREELKQLKALKRKEIEEKIEKLKEITGNNDIHFGDVDLEADFDPAEHDRKMTEIFDDQYYATNKDNEKPTFPEIDEELNVDPEWDNYDPTVDSDYYASPHCDDPDFNMDADYDPSKPPEPTEDVKTKKRRRRSKFGELIAKEKPKYNPEVYRSYQDYFDQYYSLDYEDMIGDLPCRFKYRKVVPNDYGLSLNEILIADDRELNKWCSLKKALQHRPEYAELNDVHTYRLKGKNETLKRKILKSLYTEKKEDISSMAETTTTEVENTSKRHHRSKKKQSKVDISSQKNCIENGIKAENVQNLIDENDNESKSHKRDITDAEIILINSDKNNTKATSKNVTIENTDNKMKNLRSTSTSPVKLSKKKKSKHQPTDTVTLPTTNSEENSVQITSKNTTKQSTSRNKKLRTIKDSKNRIAKTKSKKKSHSKNNPEMEQLKSLDAKRLKTYGISLKKITNKLKYSKG